MANRATMQTGDANSIADAYAARAAVTTAMEEAAKALAAATAAAGAGNVAAAAAEQAKAVAAQDGGRRCSDSRRNRPGRRCRGFGMVELKIAATVKSVGDTTDRCRCLVQRGDH